MSYLKPPPTDPIEIEGAVFYNYVIAQSGATAISVEDDPDFEFHLIVDAPALLRIKFIGTIPEVDPIYKTVTVNLAFPEGRAIHEINLKILVLAPLLGRRLPNITTVRRINVVPGAWVDFRILTDLPRCNGTTITENCVSSYAAFTGLGANVLPGGLTINAFGRITGSAPTTSSTWVISLRASSWHGNRYIRYMVLFVGNGGDDPPLDTEPPEIIPDPDGNPAPDPETLPPEPADTDPINFGAPPGPGPFYDGDYTIPQIAGMPEYEIPFKDDPKPYIYTMTYWQFLYNYSDIELGTGGPNGGVYVGLVPGSFKQIGGGVVEFKRQFAMNPATRNEYETFIYDYHFVFYVWGTWPDTCKVGTPLLVHSRIQYDYYYTLDPTNLPLPHAPRIMETGCLGMVMRGEFPDVDTPTGEEVLAEDATYKIWRPGIYERRMRFVKWISSVDLWFNTAP